MNTQLLSTDEAAEYLGLSPYVLQRDRCSPNPTIPVIYVRSRTPRYATSDLEQYLESHRIGPEFDDDIAALDVEEFDDLDEDAEEDEL